MGWKIPEIKIRMPKVRMPKAPAGRVIPKPRVRKPAGKKIEGFSLTVFSSNMAPKGTKKIDVIRELLASGGNRTSVAQKLIITPGAVSWHAKSIRQMPDEVLQKYATGLRTTVDEIRRVCADFGVTKKATHIEIIRELLACGGDRAAAARRLGINNGIINRQVKDIRHLPEADLQKYAEELNTSAGEIRRVCADFNTKKGMEHINIIKELLASGGNRQIASRVLRISNNGVGCHAKNVRQLPEADLRKYAKELNTSVGEIRRVCADFGSSKGITHIDVIRELLACGGNRTDAARVLGITPGDVSRHSKNIRILPDIELQKYASRLSKELRIKITIYNIRDLVAPRRIVKSNFERRSQVIQALLAADGNRRTAARKLGVNNSVVGQHAKNIRQLSDMELQKYVSKLNTTTDEIRRVCADLASTKGITHIDIISVLLACGGNRKSAAQRLGIDPSCISRHAKNIRQLPDAQLRKYASRLNTAVDEIKRVCADFGSAKGITHIDIIRELLASGGNIQIAAKNLKIVDRVVIYHKKNIMRLPDANLARYAAELGVSVEQIKQVCASRLDRARGKLFGK